MCNTVAGVGGDKSKMAGGTEAAPQSNALGLIDTNYTIIGLDDLDRIKKEVGPSLEYTQSLKLEKEQKHKLSVERAKTWPNTIEALRAKKLRARKQRFEIEEEERRRVDAEEKEYQARVRTAQIERANKILRDELMNLRAFHSALMVSDVLQERKAQIEYKKQMAEKWKKQDEKFRVAWLARLEEQDRKELKRQEEELKAALAQRDVQLQQLEERRLRKVKEKEEKMEEGLRHQRIAKEALEEEKRKAAKRRQAILDALEETSRVNATIKSRKEAEKAHDKHMDEKIRDFREKKEKALQEQREKELKKITAFAELRDRLIAQQEKTLLEAKRKADERITKFEKEREEKEDLEAKIREEIRKKEIELMRKQREKQLAKRENMLQAKKEEKKRIQEQMIMLSEQLKQEERDIIRKEREKNKEHAAFLLRSMGKHERRKKLEDEKERRNAARIRKIWADDDAAFKAYTEECMEEWKAAGKSVVPMHIVLYRKQKLGSGLASTLA